MSDTCVAPRIVGRPLLVPAPRHSAEDRPGGPGLSAAELIARLGGNTAPPSGGRRSRRAARELPEPPAPGAGTGGTRAGLLTGRAPVIRPGVPRPVSGAELFFSPAATDPAAEPPTAALPVAAATSAQRPAEQPPAGLTGSFFTRGLGREHGTGVLPGLAAAVRSPRTVAAAAAVTLLGTTAVLTGLPTPGGELAKVTGDTDSPTFKLAAADATLTGGDTGAGTGNVASPLPGTTGVAPLTAENLGALPRVFEQADAARIAAVQKADADRAAEDRRNALRRAAQAAAGGTVGDVVGQVTGTGAQALAAARTRLGMPYQWGASGPNAFDCSGLTSWAFRQAGITLPRTSAAQSTFGTPVSKANLQPGDLVFFYSPVSHVGIYLGGGQILHASESGEPVKISDMSAMPFHNAMRI